MAKQPVKRQKAMFGAVGGGNSTKAESMDTVTKTVSNPRDSLDTVCKPSNDGVDTGAKPEWPARVKALGLSLAEFGRLTGTPYQTLKDQASGKARTQGAVLAVLLLMELDSFNIMRLKHGGDNAGAAQGAAKL